MGQMGGRSASAEGGSDGELIRDGRGQVVRADGLDPSSLSVPRNGDGPRVARSGR